ncbi:MAG: hypothetical protein Q7K21_02790 [Elusimicrobiota bacterium]|nr:hypothetical protein [Elusimicrobiota bacterium]
MKKLLLFFLAFFVLLKTAYSFDLCPACSPETVSSQTELPGYMLGKNRLSFIGLYRFGEEPEHAHGDFERVLVAFNYGVTDRFKAGLMYGISSKKLSLQVDYLLLQEKGYKPSLILGIGSIRGVSSESHPYIIAMKSLQPYIKLPIRISAGIKHKGDDLADPQLESVGHLIFNIYRSVHIMGIFEGSQFDLAMYGTVANKFIIGMRMIELKTPAVGAVVRW